MANSKSKLQIISKGKSSSPVKFGASTSSKKSPLMQAANRKNYKKPDAVRQTEFAVPGFGDTGLTGES